MEVTVALSANAGVAISCGGYRIWVDALHDRKVEGFSAVDAQLQGSLMESKVFAHPDYICYTHCHPDHFSEDLTRAAGKLWPNAKLILPERVFAEQVLVSGEEFAYSDGALTLRFIRLPHEGAIYADTVHYGILISLGDKNILIPGDCQTAYPGLAAAIKDVPIDLALLNFPWVTLAKGRKFLREIMKPGQVIACHLPFAEDDCFGYRKAAEKAVFDGVRLLYEPLQEIKIEI